MTQTLDRNAVGELAPAGRTFQYGSLGLTTTD